MKCWAVRKVLPLCVGDKDLPFFEKSAGKHIQECSHCRQVYQQYRTCQSNLVSLKKLSPPTNNFDRYWREIQQRLESEKQVTNYNMFSIQRLLMPVAAALVLVVSFIGLQNFPQLVELFNPQAANITTPINTNRAGRTVTKPPHTPIVVKEQPPVLLKHKSNKVEYELYEVHILEAKDTEF